MLGKMVVTKILKYQCYVTFCITEKDFRDISRKIIFGFSFKIKLCAILQNPNFIHSRWKRFMAYLKASPTKHRGESSILIKSTFVLRCMCAFEFESELKNLTPVQNIFSAILNVAFYFTVP